MKLGALYLSAIAITEIRRWRFTSFTSSCVGSGVNLTRGDAASAGIEKSFLVHLLICCIKCVRRNKRRRATIWVGDTQGGDSFTCSI